MRDLGEVDEVTIGQERWTSHLEPIDELPPPPSFSDTLEDVTFKVKKRLGRLSAPRNLSSPHHLIQDLLVEDERKRTAAEGQTYVWDKPRFDEPAARRRLKILNCLFLMLSKGGFHPTLGGKDAEQPGVSVGNFHVSFKLEKIAQRPRSSKRLPRRPKEPLQLEISNWTQAPIFPRQVWQDSSDDSLENHLPEIAINLVVAGEMLYRGDVIRRYNWIAQRKAEQDEKVRLAAEKAAREAEAARLADQQRRHDILLTASKNRQRAREIRDLVEDAQRHSSVFNTTGFLAWRNWALSEADQLDPFITGLTTLLGAAPESSSLETENPKSQ